MPFRFQRFAERCTAGSCEEEAALACPRCRVPLCAAHTCEPYGCCEGCATEIYFGVSRAGQRPIVGGSAAALISTLGLYALYAVPAAPPLAVGAMVVGIAVGLGAILWGGAVSPRLADRSYRRQLRHSRLLCEPSGHESVPASGRG